MTTAFRYLLLGFVSAAILQVWRDPPTWALLVAFYAGFVVGALFTFVHMHFVDFLEKRDL